MKMHWIIIVQFLFISFHCPCGSFASVTGRVDSLSAWVGDRISQNAENEIDRTISKYPEKFSGIDMHEVYYRAGMKFYNSGEKMLGLKSFQKGFTTGNTNHYCSMCGFYSARILYQIGDRKSSLSTLNELLTNVPEKQTNFTSDIRDLIKRARWEYVSQAEGLADDSISGLDFNGRDVWVATWSGGIARYIKDRNQIMIYKAGKNGLISNFARDIKLWRDRIWVATTEGLCSYDPLTGKWKRAQGFLGGVPVKKLKTLSGNLYAAPLGRGLYINDGLDGKWKPFFTNVSNVTDLMDDDGTLYISALDEGLFTVRGNAVVQIVSNLSIMTLYKKDRDIWAGTYGHGLIRINAADSSVSRIYTTKEGLCSDYIEAIESDSNRLILATLGGGAQFYDPQTGKGVNLTVSEGLPSNDIMRIALEGRNIWFGALSGGIGIYYR